MRALLTHAGQSLKCRVTLSLSLAKTHCSEAQLFFFKIKVVQLFQHSHASTFRKFVLVKELYTN